MVTLKTAENALKTVYLGVVSDQINTKANPLLTKIKQTTGDVWGKQVNYHKQDQINMLNLEQNLKTYMEKSNLVIRQLEQVKVVRVLL